MRVYSIYHVARSRVHHRAPELPADEKVDTRPGGHGHRLNNGTVRMATSSTLTRTEMYRTVPRFPQIRSHDRDRQPQLQTHSVCEHDNFCIEHDIFYIQGKKLCFSPGRAKRDGASRFGHAGCRPGASRLHLSRSGFNGTAQHAERSRHVFPYVLPIRDLTPPSLPSSP